MRDKKKKNKKKKRKRGRRRERKIIDNKQRRMEEIKIGEEWRAEKEWR